MAYKDGFIGIDYDEFDQDSYRAVKASAEPGAPFERFSTGDVCADFVAGLKWLREQGCKEIGYSSTVDQFLMDGDQYQYNSENLIVPVKVTQ